MTTQPDEDATLDATLTDADRAVLDDFAAAIIRHGLAPAALLVFPSLRSLGPTSSQLGSTLRPILAVVWPPPHRADELQRVLALPGAAELLRHRLEARR